jgi:hypothetical protein
MNGVTALFNPAYNFIQPAAAAVFFNKRTYRDKSTPVNRKNNGL